MIGLPLERVFFAASSVALYSALCGATWHRQRQKRCFSLRAAQALMPAATGAHTWVVAYASQTGNAEQIAWSTGRLLHTAGLPAQVLALNDLRGGKLDRIERALFVVSTYGEGDAPDSAAAFARDLMGGECALDKLHYGLLALGDDAYRNFCGFGRTLDEWLGKQGARKLFERIDVSNDDSAALAQWHSELSHVAGTDDMPDWESQPFEHWMLSRREHLNPGSAGEPAFRLDLVPAAKDLPDWESGDLIQIVHPEDSSRPREYSIASMPSEGSVRLLVRRSLREDGRPGLISGWLTGSMALDVPFEARIRRHRNFHLGANAARDLILIGNGTGLAGLRAHLKARETTAARNWLIFGERNRAHDHYFGDELEQWQADGVLTRCDLVYSRDQAERRYAQDRLLEVADEVRAWIEADAAIYVCGSLEGMASGVEAAVVEILGRDAVDGLIEDGRYRRDVY